MPPPLGCRVQGAHGRLSVCGLPVGIAVRGTFEDLRGWPDFRVGRLQDRVYGEPWPGRESLAEVAVIGVLGGMDRFCRFASRSANVRCAVARSFSQLHETLLRGRSISRFSRRTVSFHHRELRPDVVLQWTDPDHHNRWLLVECKLSESMKVGHAARQALGDLLAYRRRFDAALTGTGDPYGLGVAWGEGLDPAIGTEVVLCTPDTLAEAVGQIVTNDRQVELASEGLKPGPFDP